MCEMFMTFLWYGRVYVTKCYQQLATHFIETCLLANAKNTATFCNKITGIWKNVSSVASTGLSLPHSPPPVLISFESVTLVSFWRSWIDFFLTIRCSLDVRLAQVVSKTPKREHITPVCKSHLKDTFENLPPSLQSTDGWWAHS